MGVQINGTTGNVIATKGTFSGNVGIAGTLTYEDVTDIDAVGLITARNGIEIGASPGVGASISRQGNAIFSGITTIGSKEVGAGITLSPDGDIFFTGIITGNGSGLSNVGVDTAVVFTDKLGLGDNERIALGIGSDLNIYHDGTRNIVEATGQLRLCGTTNVLFRASPFGDVMINGIADGAVELFYDNSKKLETSDTGVTVTGTLSATAVTGDGSALTGIAVGVATTVATGITGITTVLDLSNNDHKITVSGITTIDVRGGTEGHSHSLRIINSGITTVGFSTYFLFPSGGTPNLPTADGALSMISFTVHRQGVVGLATQLFAGGSVNFS